MIQSLNQINTALVRLSQQLSNKQTTNQNIRKCIKSLVQQVKFLDEKQRYNYYLLISQIYATRFQNIQDATNELKQFGKTLDSEISMNCELRIAFFHYFQLNYKEAFKHLDLALGQVQEELKLIDNAKFFFNRVLNKDHLISQSKHKLNFESGFILSLIYQHQNQYILALKQIQSFLDHSHDLFVKFQIYTKLLELYHSMKKNSISTISVSKKSIETYRQDLQSLQNTYPHFQENYQYKCKFINRVINFIDSGSNQHNQKLMKKMLDFKLLAYYKLKKCSKQAPSRDIKDALQETAKLIKASKSTQLLENILNYDFIKQQYQTFKVFYKPSIFKKLYNIKFFFSLCNYEPGNILSVEDQPFFKDPFPQQNNTIPEKSLFSKKSKQPQFQPEYEVTPPLSSTKYKSPKEQPIRPFSFKQSSSALKNTSQMAKKPKQEDFQMKQTESILNVENFEGSKMYKFNATSSGHEERYFYIIPQKIEDKPKLYYCMNKNSKSSADSYYSLKGLKKIVLGKKTDTLKKKQAQNYSDSQCFALIFEDGKDRSFYVPNEQDLQKWVLVLQTKILYTQLNIQKMTRTMGFKQDESKKNMNRSSPSIKKSKIKIDI